MGWCWGGSQRRHLQYTSSSLETARNNQRPGSMLGLARVVTERCWTESAGLRDRRQASDERGLGGRCFESQLLTRALFYFLLWSLEFQQFARWSSGRSIRSLKNSQRWAGWLLCCGPRGVVATSVAGVHKSRAMHKSPTVDVIILLQPPLVERNDQN
jgi:hypothetical protein